MGLSVRFKMLVSDSALVERFIADCAELVHHVIHTFCTMSSISACTPEPYMYDLCFVFVLLKIAFEANEVIEVSIRSYFCLSKVSESKKNR